MYLPPRDALLASIATGTWPDISPYTTLPLRPNLFDDGLHWWQFDLLCEVAAQFRAGYRRVLLQLATGGGKTVLALSALMAARRQGLAAQFLVHRKELLKQTSDRFISSALEHSFVAADFPFDPSAGLLLSGVQTLVRRLGRVLPPVLVIVDECHHSVSSTYADILERWPNAFILGLTATPERLDGRGLGEQYDVMVRGPSPRWLMDNGYLSDFDAYSIGMPDFTGVPSTGGDFQRDAAAAVMNQPKLVGNVVEHYLELGAGEQAIGFGQNVAHSRAIADAFKAHGIPAMHVDGETPTKEREWFDAAYRAGDIRVGVCAELFSEGYDVPNVSYLFDASRSKSLIKVKQRHGRPLRYRPGKRAVIADHAGNIMPVQFGGQGHGLPDEDVDYSLDGAAARTAATEKDWTSITQCMDCFRIYPSASRSCPGCKSERQVQPREIKQVEGKLTKVERDALKQAESNRKKAEERSCRSYEELVSLGKARGYRFPDQWARRRARHLRVSSSAVEIPEGEYLG